MEKQYLMKKWTGVLIILLMLTSIGSVSAVVNQGQSQQGHISVIQLQKKVPPPSCDVLWSQRYMENGPSFHIATDENNDVYVCGGGNFGDGVVMKYYSDGTLAWESTPTALSVPTDLTEFLEYIPNDSDVPGSQEPQSAINQDGAIIPSEQLPDEPNGVTPFSLVNQILNSNDGTSINMLSDITCDGNGGVFVCGSKFEVVDNNITCVSFIVKLDALSGDQVWNKSFSIIQTRGISLLMAIALDDEGDIYTAGCVATLSLNQDILTMDGVTIKVGPYGVTRWIKIDHMDYMVMYNDVTVDSQGYPYVLGSTSMNSDLSDTGIFIGKRNSFLGALIDSYHTLNDGVTLFSMVIDKTNGNVIYTVGGTNEVGIISKYTSSLDSVYQAEIPDESFCDGAMLNNYLVVTSKIEGNPPQYTIAIHKKTDGQQIAKFRIGDAHVQSGDLTFLTASGIAVDSQHNVVVCGGTTEIDTIKCHINGIILNVLQEEIFYYP